MYLGHLVPFTSTQPVWALPQITPQLCSAMSWILYILKHSARLQWPDEVLQVRYVGVSFKDLLLSTRLGLFVTLYKYFSSLSATLPFAPCAWVSHWDFCFMSASLKSLLIIVTAWQQALL